MDNKEFDELIKKKLESLGQIGGHEDDWSTFKKMWEKDSLGKSELGKEEPSEEDAAFDSLIKKNLENLRMPFNSSHWIRLKECLEAEALFKKKLFVAKSLEIIILVLFVIGILNVMPIQHDVYKIPIYDSPMVASVPVDAETAKIHNEQTEISSSLADFNKILRNKLSIPKLDATIFDVSKSIQDMNSTQGHKDIRLKSNTTLHQLPFLDILIDEVEHIASPNDGVPIVRVLKEDDNSELLLLPLRPIGLPDMVVPTTPKKVKENSYVTISAGPRVNLIDSPFDPVYEVEGYNTFVTNFGINATISREVGPFEFYTGLGYSETSYAPLIIKETYNKSSLDLAETSLDNISFSTFSIPSGLRYNFVERDGFQMYGSLGLDVNVIGFSDFEITDEPAHNNGLLDSTSFRASNPNQNSLLATKTFREGMLQGGSIKNNLYASASIGVGVVKSLSSNMSLFAEPKYNHFISSNGLGPNNDKVHKVSLDLGLKIKLN